MDKVNTAPDKNGCLNWTGSTHVFKYGEFRFNGTLHRSHRVSFQIHHGPIPSGYNVNHKCDNPLCVNPDHLYLGTQSENMRDVSKRGRSGQRKLSEKDVKDIKLRLSNSQSMLSISRIYNVSDTTIRNIRDGNTYRYI